MSDSLITKLVRDLLPTKWSGKFDASFVRVKGETLKNALKDKLIEEAHEVAEAETLYELQSEIGDVLDIIDQLIEVEGLSKSHIDELRATKRENWGGFKEGWFVVGSKFKKEEN